MTRYPWPPPELAEWCAEVDADPTPTWLLQDLVPADAAVLVSGRPKTSFKTWFAFQCVLSIASGKSHALVQPFAVEGAPVGVFALEIPRKHARDRWAWLMNGMGLAAPPNNIWFAHRYPLLLNEAMWKQRLRDFVAARGLRFVVIDTLAKAMQGDENNVADVSEVMRAVDTIRSAGQGTSVMYLHHLRKPPQATTVPIDIDDRVRGSSALTGFYDVHLAFEETPNREDLLLTVRSSSAEEKYYKVRWEISAMQQKASLHMEVYDPQAAPEVAECMRLLNMLEEGTTYTFKQLCEHWTLPSEMIVTIRDTLVQNGAMARMARGWRRVI